MYLRTIYIRFIFISIIYKHIFINVFYQIYSRSHHALLLLFFLHIQIVNRNNNYHNVQQVTRPRISDGPLIAASNGGSDYKRLLS